MENLTEEQRQIAKLEIMLDVCRRDKDALRYQLNESKRKSAEQSVYLTAFGAGMQLRFAKFVNFIRELLAKYGGR